MYDTSPSSLMIFKQHSHLSKSTSHFSAAKIHRVDIWFKTKKVKLAWFAKAISNFFFLIFFFFQEVVHFDGFGMGTRLVSLLFSSLVAGDNDQGLILLATLGPLGFWENGLEYFFFCWESNGLEIFFDQTTHWLSLNSPFCVNNCYY